RARVGADLRLLRRPRRDGGGGRRVGLLGHPRRPGARQLVGTQVGGGGGSVNIARRVLVTGADGFLGRGVVAALAADAQLDRLVALDVRQVPVERRVTRVTYRQQDVRDAAIAQTIAEHAIDTVVHLASIVTPGKGSNRAFE